MKESVADAPSGLLAEGAGLWLTLTLSTRGNPTFLPTIRNVGWIVRRVKETSSGHAQSFPLEQLSQ